MLVGVNTLGLVPGHGGGPELFLRKILDRMAKMQPHTRFTVFTDPVNDASFKGWERVCLEEGGARNLLAGSGGALVAAAKRMPGHVVGDGRSTIEELVEEVNKDPRRGVGHEKVLTRLEFDHQADRLLDFKGYDRKSVPAEGEIVFLRSTANLSTGGTAIDVTDIVHPDNRDMAERAIMALGLDVGGVDFITTDISKSYRETGGGICECNAAPARAYTAPRAVSS